MWLFSVALFLPLPLEVQSSARRQGEGVNNKWPCQFQKGKTFFCGVATDLSLLQSWVDEWHERLKKKMGNWGDTHSSCCWCLHRLHTDNSVTDYKGCWKCTLPRKEDSRDALGWLVNGSYVGQLETRNSTLLHSPSKSLSQVLTVSGEQMAFSLCVPQQGQQPGAR